MSSEFLKLTGILLAGSFNHFFFFFSFCLQNPLQFGDSDCDTSEAECSDTTIRNNKVGAPSSW